MRELTQYELDTNKLGAHKFLAWREEQNKPEEKQMSSSRKNLGSGTCECCGKNVNIIHKHFDGKVCKTCVTVRSVVKNNPQAIVTAMRAFLKDEEIKGFFGFSGTEQTGQLSAEPAGKVNPTAAALSIKLGSLERENKRLKETITGMTEKNQYTINRLSAESVGANNIAKECEDIAWKLAMTKMEGGEITIAIIKRLKKLAGKETIVEEHIDSELPVGQYENTSTN